MSPKQLDELVLHLENYLECWKQFNHFLSLARARQFTPAEESQFLELKSVLTQQLEVILAAIESGAPSREEVHTLLGSTPSIRFLSELTEGSQRGIENQWHKLYIHWQSLLGQLKVQHRQAQSHSLWSRLFSR